MRFSDSETQRLLRTTARGYLAGAYPWERLYRFETGEEGHTSESLHGLAELGWFGLIAPEGAGGGGATLLDAGAVIEELGYAAVPSPVAATNIAAHLLLAAAGDGTHAGALASGQRLLTVSEAVRRRQTPGTAALSISSGKIDGTLPLVPFAELSEYVLGPAVLDGTPAFVALPLSGATLEPVAQLDRRGYAHVRFNGAAIDDGAVLATGEHALNLHERCDALVTAFSLIELAGMMQRALELTAAHISTRVQFGQPIGKFQAARHRAAEMLMQVETTRWAAYHALWRFENDPRDTEEIWLTKHWAARAADRVFQNSHMLHGGVGVGMEHPLHLFTQGIAAFAVRGGTVSEMTARTVESLRLTGTAR